jgi:hypothetical protein
MRGETICRKFFVWTMCGALLLAMFSPGAAMSSEKQLKAGFVYVGPVGDYGWSHAHDVGRKYAEKQLPWLKPFLSNRWPKQIPLELSIGLFRKKIAMWSSRPASATWTTPSKRE